MRLGVLCLLCLAACGKAPAAPPANAPTSSLVLRGRALRVEWDDQDRELRKNPVPGTRVAGSGWAIVAGETRQRSVNLGPVTAGEDGAFELPVPEAFATCVGARSTWNWGIDLRAEDDEVLIQPETKLRQVEEFKSVVVGVYARDPERPADVRRLVEELRKSRRKEEFSHGMDALNFPDEEDGSNPVFDLTKHADFSRAAREVLRGYEKDSDEKIRALAYAVLAGQNDCGDDVGRPRGVEDAETARRLLDWCFRAVVESKHGGHLALGTDLDDGCSRCYGIWEDAGSALEVLGAESGKAYLAARAGKGGQAEVLRRLLLRERGRGGWKDLLARAQVDFELPAIDGEAILYRGEGLTLRAAKPERDAESVAVSPAWLHYPRPDLSPDGGRLIAVGNFDDLWMFDLRSLRGGRAGWGGAKHWMPRWLPGDRALFVALVEPEREFRILDLKTGRSEKLGSAAGWGEFDVDREGRRLVGTWSEGEQRDVHSIRIMDLAGGRSEILLSGPSKLPPRWSPDGRKVVVGRDSAIAVVDVASRKVATVAPLLLEWRAPYAWSADSARLAWVRSPAWGDRKGKGALMLSTLDGSPPRVLAEFDGELAYHAPAWSPDGTRIAFAAPRGEDSWIHVVSADGDTLFPVCPGGRIGPLDGDPLLWIPAPK